MNHDELVIPTLLKNKGEKSLEDYGPDAFPPTDVKFNAENGSLQDEIAPENMKYAEPLIPIFGEEMVKRMYSKRNWNVRDEGLKLCEDFIKERLNNSNPGKVGIFQGALTASGHALDDKIVQVNQRGMNLL